MRKRNKTSLRAPKGRGNLMRSLPDCIVRAGLRSLCFLAMTGFSYSIIFFFLNINPANATTIPTLSPHITISGTVNTSFCLGARFAGKPTAGCHDIHEAPDPGYQSETSDGNPPLLFESDEVDVCYSCHDGTSDTSDVKGQFGYDTGEKTSAHNIFIPKIEGGLLCSDCHSSHYAADDGQAPHEANEVIVLLRVKIEDFWKYLISALSDWVDEPGDKERLSNPIDFCGGCHGSPTSAYGDHVTYFSGSAHETELPNPPTSGTVNTEIKCNVCHNQHGSDNEKLLSERINGVTVSANDNQVCYACHVPAPDEGGAYYGKALFEETKHFTVTDSSAALVSYTSSYEAGYCMNCHNPHGTEYNDFRRSKNDLCFACHDAPGYPPANYSYRGDNLYNTSAHADSTDNETIWPSTGYTGDVIGGGGGATKGECINCHAPMGRDNGTGTTTPYSNLLLTWQVLTDSNEQYLCFGDNIAGSCHDNSYGYNQPVDTFYGMTDSIDIYNNFTAGSYTATSASGAEVNTSHDIFKADQDISGAKVECSDCHNTHINNKDYNYDTRSRIADPDNIMENYTVAYQEDSLFSNGESFEGASSDNDSSFGTSMPNFVNYCLKCHDGEAPSGVIGATKAFNISTSYSAGSGADAHGRGIASQAFLKDPYIPGGTTVGYSAMNCNDCHDSHGTSNLYNLKNPVYINGQYMAPSVSAAVTDSYYGGPGGWCTTCHSELPVADGDHDAGDDCGSCHSHGSNF